MDAVIAQHEAVFYRLQSKIDAPVCAVHGNLRVVIQGGICTEVLEHVVNQCFLHVRGIGVIIVQDELIQAETRLVIDIAVELQLEAVAVSVRVARNGCQGRVALRADGNLIEHRAVDLDIAGMILFCGGVGQNVVPVILGDDDIDVDDFIGIEQLGFVR